MWEVTQKDFEKIDAWGLEKNPFKAIDDFSERKKEFRWLNPEHREAYAEYIQKRLEYIGQKDFDDYYKKAIKPIDKIRWNYLMNRKAWFIMPLGWENIAINGGSVVDCGCGDGDTVQRIINFVDKYWKDNQIIDKKIHITGIDLNQSRVDNANNLVKSSNSNITFEFQQRDIVSIGLEQEDSSFDYLVITGVIEIIDDASVGKFIDEVCRVTNKGLYIEDLFEKFPGGIPRDDLKEELEKRNFQVKKRHVILSEPFDIDKLQDPMKLWPIMLDQNIWAERK
jgi:ubiquinone/menaquinone biosynthesis C-methylase UbiE